MGGLTEEQLYSIAVTERIVSFFSISGTLFIITTFLSSSMFDKAINRLVFYAAWGNLLANVATLISINGIDAGPHSALCQFQGFLVQMLMPADALWTLAMACNVYLTFFCRFTSHRIKAMEWKYGLFCYGMPFVLAFTYLFIETQARGKIYGPAILWCWVSIKWDPLRIGLFYGPVWLVTAATSAVYLRVGRDIFMKREQLAMFPITAPQYGTAMLDARRESVITTTSTGGLSRNNRKESDANAWGYARVAFMFFLAMIITWIPSSINCVYSLIYPDRVNYGLNFAAGLVLPAQGFWNALIYIMTSLPACTSLLDQMLGRAPRSAAALRQNPSLSTFVGERLPSTAPDSIYDSSSIIELRDNAGRAGRTQTPTDNASHHSNTSHPSDTIQSCYGNHPGEGNHQCGNPSYHWGDHHPSGPSFC